METFLSFLNLPDYIIDAVVDSVKTLPFLFVVFLFIEIFEYFFLDKVHSFLEGSKKTGPLIGTIVSSIPQCGFSVIISSLYTKGLITRGTIIASFLATSDEAVPVLLMYPEYFSFIVPLILIKILFALPLGYLADLIFKQDAKTVIENDEEIKGCCRHELTKVKKRDFIIHPVKHSINIFLFILALTLILSYLIETMDFSEVFKNSFAANRFIEPLLTVLFGLIPNCAVSVGLVIMFIKGTITFSSLVSGLMASSGIGLLVLFKGNKNKKDTFLILFYVLLVSYISGLIIGLF